MSGGEAFDVEPDVFSPTVFDEFLVFVFVFAHVDDVFGAGGAFEVEGHFFLGFVGLIDVYQEDLKKDTTK